MIPESTSWIHCLKINTVSCHTTDTSFSQFWEITASFYIYDWNVTESRCAGSVSTWRTEMFHSRDLFQWYRSTSLNFKVAIYQHLFQTPQITKYEPRRTWEWTHEIDNFKSCEQDLYNISAKLRTTKDSRKKHARVLHALSWSTF